MKFNYGSKLSAIKLILIATLFISPGLYAQMQTIDSTIAKATGITHGYHLSLPLDYTANPAKKYPLLIAIHGRGERGNGSLTDLQKLLNASGSVANVLHNSNFPASFVVNDDTLSFIVVCPQYEGTGSIFSKPFIQFLKTRYRIDGTRVYFTGLSEGAAKAWHSIGSNVNYIGVDSIAAMVLVSQSVPSQYIEFGAPFIDYASESNIPIWVTYNSGETEPGVIPSADTLVYNYNNSIPTPTPLAKKQVFTASGHNAWTRTYNPANIIDSANGFSIYKWMLQFTNSKLVAKAGKDTAITLPADSVVLNGSKSSVRQGRIDSVRWTKVSGPATFTITSPTSYITSVTGLVAGTYQFELKLHHSADATTAVDTVTVTVNSSAQTQTKVTQNISTNIKGYLQSLPVTYEDDTTRKFPLLIWLHGMAGVGSGSSAALDTVAMQGVPKLIRDGGFPTTFSVNGKSHSFIVVSPQFNLSTPSNPQTQINTLLDYLKANLRVDVERIYLAGQDIGGGIGYNFLIGGTTTTSVGFVDSIAAFVGAGSNIPGMNAARWARIVQSNLPQWLTHNNADPVILSSKSTNIVNGYNSEAPTPSPLARLTLFASSMQDSWTTTFDPNYILDSAQGFNAYEWMLQYTNRRLTANAGHDINVILPDTDTVLDGSKSVARGGRIDSYSWSKHSGGSVTIASPTSATTAISGLSAGTYVFILSVTHDSLPTPATDTVTVTVTNSSPRVAAPVVNLANPDVQTDELLSAKINPTVAHSQLTVVITGRATGKTNLQISSMDGKRLQRQSFVKDAAAITRTVNVGSLTSGIYLVEISVNGKHRKVLRFMKH